VVGSAVTVAASLHGTLTQVGRHHGRRHAAGRCRMETGEKVIDAFFDFADAIITVRSLIRRAWITHRWETRPARRR
jgi:hypothetical protein